MVISETGAEMRCHWWDPKERRFGEVRVPETALVEAKTVDEAGRTRKQYGELLDDISALSRSAQEQLMAFLQEWLKGSQSGN